jgi:hypothetical protein
MGKYHGVEVHKTSAKIMWSDGGGIKENRTIKACTDCGCLVFDTIIHSGMCTGVLVGKR